MCQACCSSCCCRPCCCSTEALLTKSIAVYGILVHLRHKRMKMPQPKQTRMNSTASLGGIPPASAASDILATQYVTQQQHTSEQTKSCNMSRFASNQAEVERGMLLLSRCTALCSAAAVVRHTTQGRKLCDDCFESLVMFRITVSRHVVTCREALAVS
jgi:hypothetical protein